MSLSGTVRAIAVLWLLVVGEAVLEATVTGRSAWLPGGPPEELEPRGQITRFSDAPGGNPEAFLQVAMVQLDRLGSDEALLCAQSMPLVQGVERRLILRFRDYREFRHPRDIGFWEHDEAERELEAGDVHAFRFAALPPAFVGKRAMTWLAVDYGGRENGVHTLKVREGWLRGGSRPGDRLRFETMRIRDDGCSVQLSAELDVAVVIRMSSERVADETLQTRAFWRDAVANLSAGNVSTGSLAAADARNLHPNVRDAATASVVFRDPSIADHLRRDHASWLRESDDKWAQLLAGRRTSAGEPPFDLRPDLHHGQQRRSYVARAIAVQRDQATIDELESWLAIDGISAWWKLAGIAALVFALVLRCPAAAKPHILISPSGILLLALCYWLQLGIVTSSMFAAAFAILLVPTMPRGTDRIDRMFAAIGLLASIAVVMALLVEPRPGPAFGAFAVLGRLSVWIVVARWITADKTWNAPGMFVAALISLCIASATGLLTHWHLLDRELSLVNGIAQTAAGILLLWFCLAGRRRVGAQPQPDDQTTTAAAAS